MLELPLRLALLEEVLDRILPEILGFICNLLMLLHRIVVFLMLMQLILLKRRIAHVLGVFVGVPVSWLLRHIFLHGAGEEHAARLGH